MDHSLSFIISPIAGFAVNALVQVGALRWNPRLMLLKSIFVGFFCGLLTVVGVDWFCIWSHAEYPAMAFSAISIVNILIYGALGYNYFHFINMGETARRIRLIRELHESPEGLTSSEILDRYNAAEIIAVRMRRLMHNGQVLEKDGRYFIGNPTMLKISQVIVFFKWLLLGKRSEFE